MTFDDQPFKYQFLSIDEECEKWASSRQDDTDGAPPCFTILSQFYDKLMISTFPLEEERDDLEDWFQCFHFQTKQVRRRQQGRENNEMQELIDEEILLLRGNAMDVVIMVLHPDFRGQGLAAPLHTEALSRLTRLSSDCKPLMQAVFAETNTAAAGGVSPEQSLLRHKSLNKLGCATFIYQRCGCII